jgi:excisionase family DNA binding protein
MNIEDETEFARVHGIHALNSVSHVCDEILHCSNSTVYELVAGGQLEAVKLGGATRITGASLITLLRSLPKAAITTGLSAKPFLTEAEKAKLAGTTPHGQVMRARRRGRPVGSKSRTNAEVQTQIENRPAV